MNKQEPINNNQNLASAVDNQTIVNTTLPNPSVLKTENNTPDNNQHQIKTTEHSIGQEVPNDTKENQSHKKGQLPPEWKENLQKFVSKIPYFGTPDLPLTSTTQEHLPIADILEDIVLFKDGGASLVMETSSLNFGLLSEKEQGAVVAAFAALINSLSFPIQIMVRTQRKDISGYIKYFDEQIKKITNPKLIAITDDYRQFVTESIKKKTVLGKRFFIIIPFNSLELGITNSAMSAIKRGPLPFPKDYALKKARVTLLPKRDHLIRQAGRLGLKLKQLTTSELIDLYFTINNPEPPAVKKDI